MQYKSMATKLIHSELLPGIHKAVSDPIYNTSNFYYQSLEEMTAASSNLLSDRYSRKNNPTVRNLEKKLAEIENVEDAVCLASGMAAISTTILSLLKTGDEIITIKDIYGGTYEFFTETLSGLGIKVKFLDIDDLNDLQSHVTTASKLVYLESPTNPLLKIVDIARVAQVAHTKNLMVCVDNSLASPINQSPSKLGADITIYSTTKHISGHSDVMGGVILANKQLCDSARKTRTLIGGIMNPDVAWLTLRSVRTLLIRVQQQNKNAQTVAEYLSKCERVKQVIYPGLPTHPNYELAGRQMDGFGSIITFLPSEQVNISEFFKNLQLIKIAVSLGGVETLIEPVSVGVLANISDVGKSERNAENNYIRLSVGIEDPQDIINDLEQAFK